MTRPYLDAPGPLLFAHRGGAKLWPENTMPAIEGGVAAGCRYLETDVHMTRDGHIVLFHDAKLDRTTDGRGLLRERSLAELEELDAGYRFRNARGEYEFRGRGVRIVTLRQLGAFLDGHPEVRVNLEIKQAEPSMTGALYEELEELGLRDRALVASANSSLVREFRRVSGGRYASSAGMAEIATFWAAVRTRTWRWIPIEYDALQVPVRHGPLEVTTRAFVRAAHARGVQVHVWTIDEPAQMRRLLELGVDGLMSDRPDLLTEVVRSAAD